MPTIKPPGVYVEETPSGGIAPLPTAIAAFVGYLPAGPAEDFVTVTSHAEVLLRFGGPAAGSPLSWALRLFFINGGRQALVLRLPDPVARAEDLVASLGRLAEAAPFTLLALPDVGLLPGPEAATVWASALALCRARGAFLLVDVPAAAGSLMTLRAWRTEVLHLQDSHGAAYAPWLLVADAGEKRPVPPSGAIAGLIARTDAERGVWKAPAGTTADLRGLSGLAARFTDGEQSELNPLGINLVRLFPVGCVCFGARTLDTAWRYVPVRRLFDHIARSLRQGLRALAFEPSRPAVWALARDRADAFLANLFRQGAFAGRTPREAWFVACDASTMTQADIAQGRLVLRLGVAPLKPGEFIMMEIALQSAAPGNADPP